jgi:hypothetical protein
MHFQRRITPSPHPENRFKKQTKNKMLAAASAVATPPSALPAPPRVEPPWAPPPHAGGPSCMLGLPTPAGHCCRLLVRRFCTPRRRTPNLQAPALRTSHPRWRRQATEPHPTTAGAARTNPAAAIPSPIIALELAELARLPRPQLCRPWKNYDVSTNRFFIVKVLYVCVRQIEINFSLLSQIYELGRR